MRKLFAAAFLALMALSSSAWAQVCPGGSTCNPFETYIYGQTAATAPFAGSLRIPAVPSGSATSAEYIAANVLATLSDTQTLTNKTINCSNNTCTNINLTTAVTGILPIANGGTGTATPGLVAGTNVTITGTWPNQTINSSGGGGGTPANPTATAGPTAINGVLTTFMRSDAAPAIQKGSNSQFGIVEVDGTTITSTGGVISAPGGSGGGTPIRFTGTVTNTGAAFSMGSLTPSSGFSQTNGYEVCGFMSAAAQGSDTLNVAGGSGATAINIQNATGFVATAGGEWASGSYMCFAYKSGTNVWLETLQLNGSQLVGAISQTISTLQWGQGISIQAGVGQTMTLGLSASYSPNSGIVFLGPNDVILVPQGTETITVNDGNGSTTLGAGVGYTIPGGSIGAVTVNGSSPTGFNITFSYPRHATTVAYGIVKLSQPTDTIGWQATVNPNNMPIVIAVSVAQTIDKIEAVPVTLLGTAGTADIYDIPSGSDCSSGGTLVSTTSFNLNTGAKTVQNLLSGTYPLAANHSLFVCSSATFSGNASQAGISIYRHPS